MAIDVVGRWRIKEALVMDSDLNKTWRSVEDIMADDSIDDKNIYLSKAEFLENGRLLMMLEKPDDISQEEIDEMVSSGEMELYGDYLVYEMFPWKVEDGKIMFDTGTKGEFLGEEVSPWAEITGNDEEILLFTYKLVRD